MEGRERLPCLGSATDSDGPNPYDDEEDGPRENEPLAAVEQAVLAGTRDVGDGAAGGGLPTMADSRQTATRRPERRAWGEG